VSVNYFTFARGISSLSPKRLKRPPEGVCVAGVEVRKSLPVGAAGRDPIAPAHGPEKGKKRWFQVPRIGGLVGVYRNSMQARFVVGARTFAFGLLAGAGIAAWMIPSV
jgi:hypothetical protein